jgi:hypothetical protein
MSAKDIVTIDFDGDTLIAVKIGDEIWVVIKRVCEPLRVDYSGQLSKLKTCAWAGVEKFSIPSAGGTQRANCIPLKRLPMWLATIEVNKVSPDIRAKLERYQEQAADALYDHFFGQRRSTTRSPLLADTLQPWQATWRSEFMEMLCELKGEPFTGRHPRWAARYNAELYRLICGAEVYDVMRAENPRPHRGRNRHQQFTPEAKARFELHLRIAESHLAVAASLAEWVDTLRYLYEQQALQLALPLAEKRKKRGSE